MNGAVEIGGGGRLARSASPRAARGTRLADRFSQPLDAASRGEQGDPGDLQPVRRLVGADRLPCAGANRPPGILGQRRQPLRERPGEGAPPSTTPRRRQRAGARELADDHVGQARVGEQAGQPSASSSEKGPGTPGGGTGVPSCALTASNTTPEPGVALARAPHRERDPPARPQHPPDLAGGAGGVGHEHEPLAAEDDVVGAVGLLDALEVELARAHVAESQSARRAPRRPRSSRRPRRTGPPRPPGRPARPPPVPRPPARRPARARARRAGRRQLEHPLGDRRAARVDVRRMLRPRPGHGRPHAVQVRAEVVGARRSVPDRPSGRSTMLWLPRRLLRNWILVDE